MCHTIRYFFVLLARKHRKERQNTYKEIPIKTLKYISRIIIGILGTAYLTLFLLNSLPAFRSWSANVVSDMLEKKTGGRVEIESVRLSALGRLILDNVRIYDMRDSLLLQSSRIAAKVDLLPLVRKRIRIGGAQIIGARARIYKEGKEPFNFQFLLDAFSSKDTTSSPIDLGISALVIRRGEIRYDLYDKPRKGDGLDINHLLLTDISLTARCLLQMPDTLSVHLKNLSFRERSGLNLTHLSLQLHAGKRSARIDDLLMQMPESSVSIPQLSASYNGLEQAFTEPWLTRCTARCSMVCSATPRVMRSIAPRLATFSDVLNLETEMVIKDGNLWIDELDIHDNASNLRMQASLSVRDFLHAPFYSANIHSLHTAPSLQYFLTGNMEGTPREISPLLTRLGATESTGTVTYHNNDVTADLLTKTEQGSLTLNAQVQDMKELSAEVKATDIHLGNLLDMKGKERATVLSFESSISGKLPGKEQKTHLTMNGLLNSLLFRGYEHRNVRLDGYLDNNNYGGTLALEGLAGQILLQLHTAQTDGPRSLQCQARIENLAPHVLNLTERFSGERFSGRLDADFPDINPSTLQGSILLSDLRIDSDEGDSLIIGDIAMNSVLSADGHHLALHSSFLNARADGRFNWNSLKQSFVQPMRYSLPSLFASGTTHRQDGNEFWFSVEMQDTLIAGRLLGTELRVAQKSTFEGVISDAVSQIQTELRMPDLVIGGQQLQNIECRLQSNMKAIQASLQCERMMKKAPVELNIDAYLSSDKITSRLRWDNKGSIRNAGDISMTGLVSRDLNNSAVIDARTNSSQLIIGDTLWNVNPAFIRYHDEKIDIHNLNIHQADKHLSVSGCISPLNKDTLHVKLAGVDIAKILDLFNVDKLEFGGYASGTISASSVMKNPVADANLQVENFSFNNAHLGHMDLTANWGRQPNAILFNAEMRDSAAHHHTHLDGTIIPGKGEKSGLDLNIRTQRFNIAFLQKYTHGIFRDVTGRFSGWTRVFGPFKRVNIEGDIRIDTLQTHILALGTEYHLAGDSVILRPNDIRIPQAHIYDNIGMAGMDEHTATADIHLMHDCFKRLQYDITADARNILAYNFPSARNGMSFHGTIYADARIHLSGAAGRTDIDVTATPMPGTTLVYDIATPGNIDETSFVTYAPLHGDDAKPNGESAGTTVQTPASDLYFNFEIEANPSAQLLLLMDHRSGDYISLYGNGHLRANYYNKGSFQLFGTYRVDHGNYQMSIRDLIRKDFEFIPEGTIVFGGNAMQAALNLKAKYTVPNVSLDDLSATGLGLSNTRVDCIMNIGGRAGEPSVTFDFDIPNANEDEKQMVRSMISSEEERDMQAIYLLGIGRFYSYETQFEQKQTQGSTAMNSMLSNVLTSRFNQIMSQALGGSNWSFGTSLRTGQTGWEQLDVEGMLSGRMLSGRLLFNGNFGYREDKYRDNRNTFIGDFDIKYRLSPRSPFSLKAYNQTNDRYFTQSSLTTQGIGIQFQRDFNRWIEIFRAKKEKKRSKH